MGPVSIFERIRKQVEAVVDGVCTVEDDVDGDPVVVFNASFGMSICWCEYGDDDCSCSFCAVDVMLRSFTISFFITIGDEIKDEDDDDGDDTNASFCCCCCCCCCIWDCIIATEMEFRARLRFDSSQGLGAPGCRYETCFRNASLLRDTCEQTLHAYL